MRISIITSPYNTQGKGQGGTSGPAALIKAGLVEHLQAQGHVVDGVKAVQMTTEEEQQHGGWHRVGLAGSYLAVFGRTGDKAHVPCPAKHTTAGIVKFVLKVKRAVAYV